VFTSLDFATVIFLQSEVVRLVSNPQPGGPGLCIYVHQWQGVPVISPGTGFRFRRLLLLAGLKWRYSKPPPHGKYFTIDKKGKAIPVTVHGGPQGCDTSKFPHFLDNRLTDGGEVVSLTRLLHFTP
jgi:hypothetical protein